MPPTGGLALAQVLRGRDERMPTYEYRCKNCGVFEVEQRITEDPLKTCPTCGDAVQRLISRNVNILFKGSGFHITDYRSNSKSGSENGSSSASGDGKAGGDTAASSSSKETA